MDIDERFQEIANSPELRCNHCGLVFKGSHTCDYERLKEMNEKLISLVEWVSNHLSSKHHEKMVKDELEHIMNNREGE